MVTDHQPLVRIMDQQVLTWVQTQCLMLELFKSIRSTIRYQAGKANIVASALSRSQCNVEEDSTDDSTVVAIAIEAQTSALSGVSVELTIEDLQRWTTFYKQDKSHIVVYMKLCQGQNMRTFI